MHTSGSGSQMDFTFGYLAIRTWAGGDKLFSFTEEFVKINYVENNSLIILWFESFTINPNLKDEKSNVLLRSYFLLFSIILAQAACVRHACLRAPCVAWPLLPSFSLSFFLFLFLRLLLLTHFGESPMCEIIVHPIFWHN